MPMMMVAYMISSLMPEYERPPISLEKDQIMCDYFVDEK